LKPQAAGATSLYSDRQVSTLGSTGIAKERILINMDVQDPVQERYTVRPHRSRSSAAVPTIVGADETV
jgi:hypothetical protein